MVKAIRWLTACAAVMVLLTMPTQGDEWGQEVNVDLSTPRKEFLLGEPVLLDIAVHNRGERVIKTSQTPNDYIEILVGREGEIMGLIQQTATTVDVGLFPADLEPGKPWTYRLRVLFNYASGPSGAPLHPGLAFPKPGAYTVQIVFPLLGGPEGGRRITSNTVDVVIRAPKGDDAKVFKAIEDDQDLLRFLLIRYGWSGRDEATALRVARLLQKYPETGYREASREALLAYYRSWKANRNRYDPPPEEIRQVLGEPDDRFFPNDERLDKKVTLDFPNETPLHRVFASLQGQTGVPLTASPYYMLHQSKQGFPGWTRTLREAMLMIAPDSGSAWVRRSNGYYLYCETLVGPKGREVLRELLGPVEALFPDDQRLNVEVVADFPESTPITDVLADYAEQSGVPLEVGPFFQRCMQRNEKMVLNLREEMAFLARTFQAEWEPRGEGYSLTLPEGEKQDEGREPGAAGLNSGGKGTLLGCLLVLSGIVFAFAAWRIASPWRSRGRMLGRAESAK